MGYAEDMRLFGEWTQDHRLSAQERLLYHRIRWVFDRAGDPKKLAIKSIRLMEMEEMTQSTFNRARNRLESVGLIRTETHRGQETLYELLPIIKDGLKCQSDGQSDDQSDGQSDDQSDGQSDGFRPCARAREDTYVSLKSKNNIYNNTLSLSLRNPRGGMGEGTEEREIPTIQSVTEYIRRTGLKVDAEQFIAVNQATGWTDSQGQPIRNWQIWLNGFAARMSKAQAHAERRPTALSFDQREYKSGELDYLFDGMSKYDAEEG